MAKEKKVARYEAAEKAKGGVKPEAWAREDKAGAMDTSGKILTKSEKNEAKADGAKKADGQNRAKAEKKSRKVIVKRTPEVLALRRKVFAKAGLPVFRGRFGKRSIRKKANAKWDRWRFPRGLDVNHELSEGFNPRAGYGTDVSVRHVHPSGYREAHVRAMAELGAVQKGHAVRFASGIGRKKKIAMVDMAIEKGLRVLNP